MKIWEKIHKCREKSENQNFGGDILSISHFVPWLLDIAHDLLESKG